MADLLKIKDWSLIYENNRTRDLKHMAWLPLPNRQDGDGYTELLDHPEGAAHFGAWTAIVQVASRCDPRGTLVRDGGRPHDSASLSRMSRIPQRVFDDAIPRLVSIGWITSEVVVSNTDTQIPHEGAGKPHEGAGAAHLVAKNGMNGTERKERNTSASGDAGGSRKQKDQKKTNPNHAPAVAMWCGSWKSKHGEKYTMNGKDAKHVESLLKLEQIGNDLQKFQSLIDRYLADDSAFVTKDCHTLGLLLSKHRSYSIAATEADSNGFKAVYDPTDRDLIWGTEAKP